MSEKEVKVSYRLGCLRCKNPLRVTIKVTRNFVEAHYRCLYCGFTARGVRGNDHIIRLKKKLGMSWESLVGYYDRNFNVPVDRGTWK